VIDEPASLDDYEPIRIVDSLVFHFSGRRVITQFTPNWNGYVNGDISVKKFVELTGTNTVMMDYFPFWDGHSSEFGLKHLQPVFQQTAIYSPKFYYVPQGFGQFYDQGFQQPCHWREPTPVEFKSSIMLALAHGAKGIQIWKFATDLQPHHIGWQQCESVYWKCLAESLATNYRLLPLGEIIKNDIAPRLKGHLGNTLLKLSYTGNFITRKYILPTTELFPEPQTFGYLTIGGNEAQSKDIYWQVGFFADSSNLPFNKYFLLTNLITTYPQRNIRIDLIKPVDGFYNYRFRNVEPQFNFDTTYQNTFTTIFTFPAGEGYLFQVAPVVRFGGKLYYNDTIKTNTELIEDMWIKNNVNLIIERGKYYTIKDTVTLEGTGFITGKGYLNIGQGGDIKINSWNKSVFKGREGVLVQRKMEFRVN
jgi:hypothetical protein